MNLPEALAALDALTCGRTGCLFIAAPNDRGCCDCFPPLPDAEPLMALAAVVKAARESVAASERARIARLDAEARAYCDSLPCQMCRDHGETRCICGSGKR